MDAPWPAVMRGPTAPAAVEAGLPQWWRVIPGACQLRVPQLLPASPEGLWSHLSTDFPSEGHLRHFVLWQPSPVTNTGHLQVLFKSPL